MMKVLIIEQEGQALNDVSFCIRILYPEQSIIAITEWRKALDAIEPETPEFIIASSMPDILPLELVRKIRELSDAPLLFLTGEQSIIGKAQLLEQGADECVSKPIIAIEFLSVVRALLRRTNGLGYKQDRVISLRNGLSVNTGMREVFLHEKRVNLTPHEYNLLFELVRSRGKVVASRFLLERCWGTEYVEDRDFLKKYIYRLRSKLEQDPGKPIMILSERGIGYKIIGFSLLLFTFFSVIPFGT